MIIVGIDPSINGSGVYKLILDDKLDSIEYSYLSFTSVKKRSDKNVLHWTNKGFRNYLDHNEFMYDNILEFISKDGEPDYISMEDYAFAASGKTFHIGEFVGGLKRELYKKDYKLRFYEPTTLKMFATSKGNADKVRMDDAYHDKDGNKDPNYFISNPPKDRVDLADMIEYKSPRTDIVDAYYLVKLLQLELKLRNGIELMSNLDTNTIKIFNKISKSNPTNILARDFLEQEKDSENGK